MNSLSLSFNRWILAIFVKKVHRLEDFSADSEGTDRRPPLFSKKGGGGTGMAAMKLEISEGGESVVYARLPKCILSEPGTRSVPRWFMVVIFGTILLRSL